MIDSSLESQ